MDLHAEYLIIGSGIAALRAAAALAPAGDVLVLTKADPSEGSTGYAQGGIAAAVGPDDSPERHAADTLAAGDGLCNPDAVRVLVQEGPDRVRELRAWGARFDCDQGGELALAREGAHSVRRVLHARDATGREIGRALWAHIAEQPRVRVIGQARAVAALVEDGRCAGVHFLGGEGRVRSARAAATLLATGGAGQVYRETTNPPVATGDGLSIAFRAGARVADLEFVQFHPTALAVPGEPRFLLSEALRGEGARLVGADDEPFMTRYDPAGDLAPRDRVARAMVRETARTGQPVGLSLAHLPADYVHRRFPLISAACRRAGLDLAADRIPVVPAAHYVMGGIETDFDGRSSIPGLFAAGEVACTGVHGANRLASNSLLEGLVFGARAGAGMRAWVEAGRAGWPRSTTPAFPAGRIAVAGGMGQATIPVGELRDRMWRLVGLFRTREGLEEALAWLDAEWRRAAGAAAGGVDGAGWEALSLLMGARLMTRAALRREESRGAHFRADFPARDDLHWKRQLFDVRSEDID